MPNPTLVTFLLDRSGSMLSIKPATIEGFNAYLQSLQDEQGADILFTLLTFDSISTDAIAVAVPVKKVHPLNDATYVPRGGTPLIDAAVDTIRTVESALAGRTDSPKVVVCLQTDGHENQSRRHHLEELQGLIAAKQGEGWQFNFMGAGIDAYAQAAMMGIGSGDTVSYDVASAVGTHSVFVNSARNTRLYASGATASTSYTTAQKRAAGDKFDPAINKKGA